MSQDQVDNVFNIVLIFHAKFHVFLRVMSHFLSHPAMLHEKEVSPNR